MSSPKMKHVAFHDIPFIATLTTKTLRTIQRHPNVLDNNRLMNLRQGFDGNRYSRILLNVHNDQHSSWDDKYTNSQYRAYKEPSTIPQASRKKKTSLMRISNKSIQSQDMKDTFVKLQNIVGIHREDINSIKKKISLSKKQNIEGEGNGTGQKTNKELFDSINIITNELKLMKKMTKSSSNVENYRMTKYETIIGWQTVKLYFQFYQNDNKSLGFNNNQHSLNKESTFTEEELILIFSKLIEDTQSHFTLYNTKEFAIIINSMARVHRKYSLERILYESNYNELNKKENENEGRKEKQSICFFLEKYMNYVMTPNILKGFNSQGLANIIHGIILFREIHSPPKEFISSFVLEMKKKLSNFNSQEFSMSLYSLGLLESRSEDDHRHINITNQDLKRYETYYQILESLAKSPVMKNFNAQEVSNVLYGLAKSGLQELETKYSTNPGLIRKQILPRLAEQVQKRLREFKSQEISNVLYGFAILDYLPERSIMNALMNQFEYMLQKSLFNSQELCMIAYSLGLLRYVPENHEIFFTLFFKESIKKIHSYTAQNLSNQIYGISFLEIFKDISSSSGEQKVLVSHQQHGNVKLSSDLISLFDRFLETFLDEVTESMSSFDSQNLANTVWALNNLEYRSFNQSFVFKFLKECIKKLNFFTAQELSNTIFSLAQLDYESEIQHFDTQIMIPYNMKNQKLGLKSQSFLSLFLKAIMKNRNDLTTQHISNILFAFTLLTANSKNINDYKDSEFSDLKIREEEGEMTLFESEIQRQFQKLILSNFNNFTLTGLTQLYQSRAIWFTKGDKISRTLENDISAKILKEINQSSTPTSSSFHEEVSSIFANDLGFTVKNEIFESPYHLDIVLYGMNSSDENTEENPNNRELSVATAFMKANHLPLVVEVDGPVHYYSTEPTKVKRRYQYKKKYLEADIGVKWSSIINIPYFEWTRLKNRSEKRNYLAKTIQNSLSLLENQHQKLPKIEVSKDNDLYKSPSLLSSECNMTVEELKKEIKSLLGQSTLRGLNNHPILQEVFSNSLDFPREQSKFRKEHWQNIYTFLQA